MNKLGYDHKMACWTATKNHSMMPLVVKGISSHLCLQNMLSFFFMIESLYPLNNLTFTNLHSDTILEQEKVISTGTCRSVKIEII